MVISQGEVWWADLVANVSQLVTLDKASLTDHVGRLPDKKLELVLFGIDVVLGR